MRLFEVSKVEITTTCTFAKRVDTIGGDPYYSFSSDSSLLAVMFSVLYRYRPDKFDLDIRIPGARHVIKYCDKVYERSRKNLFLVH